MDAAFPTLKKCRFIPICACAVVLHIGIKGALSGISPQWLSFIKLGTGIEKGHPDHPRWRQEYLAEYEHGFCDETVLFEGINPMLEQLARRSIAWGIITNKPHRFTSLLVPELGFIAPPAVVVSGDTCAESKPSTLPMHHACRQIGIAPERCLYVGDAERDMVAGKNAGMATALANWGYIAESDPVHEWPADARLDAPGQILDLL